MDTYFDAFRLNVKYYREKNGLNQSELAIQANSSNGMIGNIESGKARPSFKNIIAIANALGVHPADLFLRDASVETRSAHDILKNELIPQIEKFIDTKFPE